MINCHLGKGLLGALNDYKARCACISVEVDARTLQKFNDFFIKTYMANYRLYRYVMSNPRDRPCNQWLLYLHCPPDIPPLFTGTEKDIWEYEEGKKKIEREKKQADEAREDWTKLVTEQDKKKLEDAYSWAGGLIPPRDKKVL